MKEAKGNKLKKSTFLAKYRATLGNITASCEAAGISRKTFYMWKKADPDFLCTVEEVEEASVDFAESELKRQIRDGNTTATIFYLKTKGKARGYVEKQETEQLIQLAKPQDVARQILDEIGE